VNFRVSDRPPGAKPGQKNLLVRVVLRDPGKTLTNETANALGDRIYGRHIKRRHTNGPRMTPRRREAVIRRAPTDACRNEGSRPPYPHLALRSRVLPPLRVITLRDRYSTSRREHSCRYGGM